MMSNNLLANTNHGRKRDVKMIIEKLIQNGKNEELFNGKMPWNFLTKPLVPTPKKDLVIRSTSLNLEVGMNDFEILISPNPDKLYDGAYSIIITNNDILDRLKSVVGVTEHWLNIKTRTDKDRQNQKIAKYVLELCNSKSIDKSVTNSYEAVIENLLEVIL